MYVLSNLIEFKKLDLVDICHVMSRYLDNIFTIDIFEFEKQISDIYPEKLQLKKANSCEKNSVLDLKCSRWYS